MTEQELMSIGGFEFISPSLIPWGSQLAVMDNPNPRSNTLHVSISGSNSETQEIKIEKGGVSGHYYVVLGRLEISDGKYSYGVVPIEWLDRESEEIESRILHTLGATP